MDESIGSWQDQSIVLNEALKENEVCDSEETLSFLKEKDPEDM